MDLVGPRSMTVSIDMGEPVTTATGQARRKRSIQQVLERDYIIKQTLGSGGFGKVKRGWHRITEHNVAIKIMDKERLGADLHRVQLEINALKNLHHPNICKLYQVVETASHICLILEYCEGGELFDYIVDRGRVPEVDARRLFREMVCAVAYIHSKGYAHRDLKPENMLLDGMNRIRLIDFGLCASWKPSEIAQKLTTCCGSACYAAPELLGGCAYTGAAADVWSLGVLLYVVLCGSLPYEGENVQLIIAKIRQGLPELPEHLSSASKDLLHRMLSAEPKRRLTMDGVASHTWVTDRGRLPPATSYNMHETLPMLDMDMRSADALIINEMSKYLNRSPFELNDTIEKWTYDSLTGIYLIMHDRKRRGLPYKITREERQSRLVDRKGRKPLFGSEVTPIKKARRSRSLEDSLDDVDLLDMGSPPEVRRDAAHQRSEFRLAEMTRQRAIEAPDDGFVYETPQRTFIRTPGGDSTANDVSRSATPSTTARHRLSDVFLKSIGKMGRALLTPVRTLTREPRPLRKHTLNVTKVPYRIGHDDLLAELDAKLRELNYRTKIKGFVIKGSKEAESGNAPPGETAQKSKIELEIARSQLWDCLVIKRKRLHGSAIDYARVCEKLLEICGR